MGFVLAKTPVLAMKQIYARDANSVPDFWERDCDCSRSRMTGPAVGAMSLDLVGNYLNWEIRRGTKNLHVELNSYRKVRMFCAQKQLEKGIYVVLEHLRAPMCGTSVQSSVTNVQVSCAYIIGRTTRSTTKGITGWQRLLRRVVSSTSHLQESLTSIQVLEKLAGVTVSQQAGLQAGL